jgi:hypothetical protein
VIAGTTPGLVHNCGVEPNLVPRQVEHSFDEHAMQWFGGDPKKSVYLAEWQSLIERAAGSTKIVPWTSGSAQTWAYINRFEGRWFVAQFDRVTGDLVTAFVPNSGQISAMLRLLGG